MDYGLDHLTHLLFPAEELKGDLERYVQEEAELQGKVRVLRNQRREGLIRGRMIGAAQASGKGGSEGIMEALGEPTSTDLHLCPGEVLVFLDSHCEVNQMWLEPLLASIHQDGRTVVCPVIDIISADTLSYSPSPIVRGGFNWGLHFKWDPVPPSELKSPQGPVGPIR